MIQSLFILGDGGEVLIEKHWRQVSSRSLVDLFWDEVVKCEARQDVMPIISTSRFYLVNIFRHKIFFLAVIAGEIPPLMVIELLHRIFDIFEGYFGRVDDQTLKENFSTVYQLLEEVIDNGYPLITEPNALTGMVAPPTLGSRLKAVITNKSGISDVLPAGAISSIPWRKQGARYAQNEIYFDITEEINCLIDENGRLVSCSVYGEMKANSRLSGMPDLLLSFVDASVLEDVSFHPCVRTARFERDKVLSFVPPDGSFTLMRYKVARNFQHVPAPVYCTPRLVQTPEGGTVDVIIGSKPHGNSGLSRGSTPFSTERSSRTKSRDAEVDDVALLIPFPRSVRSTDLSATHGTILSDEGTKLARWSVGRIPADKSPKLTGKYSLQPSAAQSEGRLKSSACRVGY